MPECSPPWEKVGGDLMRTAVEDGWLYLRQFVDPTHNTLTYVPASKKTLSLRAQAAAGPRRIRAGD